MPADLLVPAPALLGFLLVLTRLTGAFVFLPFPGLKAAPDVAKILVALTLAVSLAPAWPDLPVPSGGLLFGWLVCEALFGLALGLVVSLFHESFAIAAQIIALQAGYSYASTIDPTNQTDSGLFPILMQFVVGLLFFAADLHHVVWRALAASLQVVPPGSFRADGHWVDTLTRAGAQTLELGLKVALPITALLLIIDLALSLLGRLNAQLQLVSLSFPIKMLASLVALAALLTALPGIYTKAALSSFSPLRGLIK